MAKDFFMFINEGFRRNRKEKIGVFIDTQPEPEKNKPGYYALKAGF